MPAIYYILHFFFGFVCQFFSGTFWLTGTLNCRAGGLGDTPSYVNVQKHHHTLRNVLARRMSGVWVVFIQLSKASLAIKISKVLFGLGPSQLYFTGFLCPNPKGRVWPWISVISQPGPHPVSGHDLRGVTGSWLSITRCALNLRLSGEVGFWGLWLSHLILASIWGRWWWGGGEER